jgi:hypothetical protein
MSHAALSQGLAGQGLAERWPNSSCSPCGHDYLYPRLRLGQEQPEDHHSYSHQHERYQGMGRHAPLRRQRKLLHLSTILSAAAAAAAAPGERGLFVTAAPVADVEYLGLAS